MFKAYGTGNYLTDDAFTGSGYTTIEQLDMEDYNHAVDIGRPIRNLYENEYETYVQFDSLVKTTFGYNAGVVADSRFRDFTISDTANIAAITVTLDLTVGTIVQYYLRMPSGICMTDTGVFYVNKPRTDILERQLFKVLQMRDYDREYVQIKYQDSTQKFMAKVCKLLTVNAVSVTETLSTLYFGCDSTKFNGDDFTSAYVSSIVLLKNIYNYNTDFNFKTYFMSALGSITDPDLSKLVCEPIEKIASGAGNATYNWKIATTGEPIISTDAIGGTDVELGSATINTNGGTLISAVSLAAKDNFSINEVIGGSSVTLFDDATAINLGAASPTLTIGKTSGFASIVSGASVTTACVFNSVATTVNAFGAATTLNLGAPTGTVSINNPIATFTGNSTNLLTVNGCTASSLNLFNTCQTTVCAFGAATTLNLGAATGTVSINNPAVTFTGITTLTIDGCAASTLNLFNTCQTTANIFGAAITINVGSTCCNSVVTFCGTKAATSVVSAGALFCGGVGIAEKLYVGSDLNVCGNTTLGNAATDTVDLIGTFTSASGIKIYDSSSTTYRYTLLPGDISADTTLCLPTTTAKYFALTANASGVPDGVSGNASTVTVAANTTNACYYPLFVTSATGSLAPQTTAANLAFNPSSGEFMATSFKTLSLRERKMDIYSYPNSALDLISKTCIVKYKFKDDCSYSEHVGFIADDTPEELSGKNKDSMLISDNIGVLIKAVQELNERIKTLEEK